MKMIGTKTTTTKRFILLISLFLWNITLSNDLNAQGKSEHVKTMPAQLTFLHPLGTNGMSAGETVNNFSINMLVGMSAGVRGAELGGLANLSKGDIRGLQVAGLANSSFGYLNGLQAAGLANFNKGPVNGLQVAGLINATTAPVIGAQLAGLVNTSTKDVHGFQASGIVNTTVGRMQGLQLGLVNVAIEEVSGSQIGLVNFTRKINGFQLGLVNVADSVGKGAGFGLINYYKNGYHRFEIESNETFYANATFKSGVEKFYVIYTVGFKTDQDKVFWAPGIGFGGLFRLSQNWDLNTDLISRHVNEDESWTDELNMLNTLRLNFAHNFTDKFALYGGPSFNMIISGIKNEEGMVIGDSFAPSWDFYDKIGRKNRVKMFIGFNAGIRL
ncbi:hypothetical protein QQ008_14055 [Fulvivirgaceae bacterium BMA10]|uniref:DUF5723 domain-containing protein n=1 Tax=Splendidivirga corallicola TaxID=3051826 RepID=A0ABT8KP57_9BACT|nr:hypothetical protein [Fulvivirgaceae bacterium BMA10]